MNTHRHLITLALCAMALLTALGCGDTSPSTPDLSSETHWMALCDDDDACGPGAQCVCGVCTVACDDNTQCDGTQGLTACVPANTGTAAVLCQGLSSPRAGICLAPCDNDDTCDDVIDGLSCDNAHCAPGPDTPAGCANNDDCSGNQHCANDTGVCGQRPGLCTDTEGDCGAIFAPVCGCDGQTYSNECEAHSNGVNVAANGQCDDNNSVDCPAVFAPVCGADGQTYSNDCFANAAGTSVEHPGECEDTGDVCTNNNDCGPSQYCSTANGTCGQDVTGTCTDQPQACTFEFVPVCGCDGTTYDNPCFAQEAGVNIDRDGQCDGNETQACGGRLGDACDEGQFCLFEIQDICGRADATGVCSTPGDICPEIFAPVCGCDGQTYSNECLAHSAGTSAAANGPCEGDERACGGREGQTCNDNEYCEYELQDMCGAADATGVCKAQPDVCTEEVDPVCGCDGETYSNACTANQAGTGVMTLGTCE